jgi:hypothetical protein
MSPLETVVFKGWQEMVLSHYTAGENPRKTGMALFDAFAKTRGMAKQKFRPTRLGVFSGAKAYI